MELGTLWIFYRGERALRKEEEYNEEEQERRRRTKSYKPQVSPDLVFSFSALSTYLLPFHRLLQAACCVFSAASFLFHLILLMNPPRRDFSLSWLD